jgi:predicted translin family RNA/ssDNA-binding protein
MPQLKKRKVDAAADASTTVANLTETQQLFDSYRQTIDDRNEQKERIFRISREVTKSSKKVIVLLQRCTDLKKRDETLVRARQAMVDIVPKMLEIARDSTKREDFQRFHRNITHGTQEFIEALSFYHYLTEGTLISMQQVQAFIDENLHLTEEDVANQVQYPVTRSDFILGICDISGELMRFATASLGAGNTEDAAKCCTFLQEFQSCLMKLDFKDKNYGKKVSCSLQSVIKVEVIAGKMLMQKKEYPDLAGIRTGGLQAATAAGGD